MSFLGFSLQKFVQMQAEGTRIERGLYYIAGTGFRF
jgi:hypothetical protein